MRFYPYILLLIATLLSTSYSTANAQARKPEIMVVPSDNWCLENGFMQTYDNQGTITKVPDYKRAVQESSELMQVISKMNELMADRGFPLKDLEGSLNSLARRAARRNMRGAQSSPIGELKKVAKADIWMQIGWTINKTGPSKSITFNLRGLDAYTDKQVAGASGTGKPSASTPLPLLLEEAVLAHIDMFNGQLQKHFDDLFENGRETILMVETYETYNGNLNSTVGGQPLSRLIRDWVRANTVKNRFSTGDADEFYMEFTQVRIPLYGKDGNSLDALEWAEGLVDMLRSKGLNVNIDMEGLGAAIIMIQ